MPLSNKGTPNTVTPGQICYGCINLQAGTCPYGNKFGDSTLNFKGHPGSGTCEFFTPYPEQYAEGNKMKKVSAKDLKEAQLNMSLYKKVMALSESNRNRLFDYWKKIYDDDPRYASELVTDYVETAPFDTEDKKTPNKGEFKQKKEYKSYGPSSEKRKGQFID